MSKCKLSFCGNVTEFDGGALCLKHSNEYIAKDQFETIDAFIAFKEDKTLDLCEVNGCTNKGTMKGLKRLCNPHKADLRYAGVSAHEFVESSYRVPAEPAAVPKQNAGKPKFSLVRLEFMVAIADVMTWGLTKYPKENYLKVPADDLYDSMMRHWALHKRGELLDEESGKPHLWHFASNAMMLFMVESKANSGQ